jgi:hypothetical protein
LYQDMIKVEKQHRGPKVDVTRNAEEIDQFLATESALDPTQNRGSTRSRPPRHPAG